MNLNGLSILDSDWAKVSIYMANLEQCQSNAAFPHWLSFYLEICEPHSFNQIYLAEKYHAHNSYDQNIQSKVPNNGYVNYFQTMY